jgi:hypothetical protein
MTENAAAIRGIDYDGLRLDGEVKCRTPPIVPCQCLGMSARQPLERLKRLMPVGGRDFG